MGCASSQPQPRTKQPPLNQDSLKKDGGKISYPITQNPEEMKRQEKGQKQNKITSSFTDKNKKIQQSKDLRPTNLPTSSNNSKLIEEKALQNQAIQRRQKQNIMVQQSMKKEKSQKQTQNKQSRLSNQHKQLNPKQQSGITVSQVSQVKQVLKQESNIKSQSLSKNQNLSLNHPNSQIKNHNNSSPLKNEVKKVKQQTGLSEIKEQPKQSTIIKHKEDDESSLKVHEAKQNQNSKITGLSNIFSSDGVDYMKENHLVSKIGKDKREKQQRGNVGNQQNGITEQEIKVNVINQNPKIYDLGYQDDQDLEVLTEQKFNLDCGFNPELLIIDMNKVAW